MLILSISVRSINAEDKATIPIVSPFFSCLPVFICSPNLCPITQKREHYSSLFCIKYFRYYYLLKIFIFWYNFAAIIATVVEIVVAKIVEAIVSVGFVEFEATRIAKIPEEIKVTEEVFIAKNITIAFVAVSLSSVRV